MRQAMANCLFQREHIPTTTIRVLKTIVFQSRVRLEADGPDDFCETNADETPTLQEGVQQVRDQHKAKDLDVRDEATD